ncbi:MAG TPA: PD-(D/E)XK motif protein [Candidatus Aminicenantes bacterium]|nr:PD-(D/E)XK motif protein [Candidatus Aminicenantes bacterium]HRY65570.1 PD-(D/E)XK motif protein [Candidatus Aminicenantes bacterium]HRZ72542.1 PD-(D/E)XK motif protein [Candidatus Aminicenantes bacterium]
MMKASEELIQIWNLVMEDKGDLPGYYYRRMQKELPFPVYAGIINPGRLRCISILVDTEALGVAAQRDETNGYSVRIELAEAGTHKSFIHLASRMEAGNDELFVFLCADLLGLCRSDMEGHKAVAAIFHRLSYWRRFFQRHGGGLSREEIIGLYGELRFLELLLDYGVPSELAVMAWKGPLGTNQDFLFGSKAVEVKCTTANEADIVKITSERQLDSTGLTTLFLFHQAFDFRENSGRTLKKLIGDIKKRLEDTSPHAIILFEELLISAGYSGEYKPVFDNYGFTERKQSAFEVQPSFPRIDETALPGGVSRVSYQLDLAVCHKYRIHIEAIFRALMTGEQSGQ